MKKITFGIVGAVLALSAGLSGCGGDEPPPAAKAAPKAKPKAATPAKPAVRAATSSKTTADSVKSAAPAATANTPRPAKEVAKSAAAPATAATSPATEELGKDDETDTTANTSSSSGGGYGGGYGGAMGSALGGYAGAAGRVTGGGTTTTPTPATEADPKVALLAKAKQYTTHYLVTGLTFTTSGGQTQSFDAYLPTEFPNKIVSKYAFVVHGGDWTEGAKEDMKPYGIALAEKGIIAIAPNYRLAPANPHPAQVNDLTDLMAYIEANPDILATGGPRYGAVGVGAGGHLTSLVALSPSANGYLSCVSNVFAQTDLTNLATLDSSIKQFLGTSYSPELVMEVSPVYRVGNSSRTPSFFLSHGTADTKVPFAQTEAFAAELQRNGLSAKVSAVKDAGHGYSEAQTKTTAAEVAGFIDSCLATL